MTDASASATPSAPLPRQSLAARDDYVLGVALAVQLLGEQPEVVLLHPPEHGEVGAEEANSRASPAMANVLNSPRRELLQAFHMPAKGFAKLVLPDEKLCNQELYLGIDAGYWEKAVPHHEYCHLHVVSHPHMEDRQVRRNTLDATKVQGFNILFVVDSRYLRGRLRYLSALSARLAAFILEREHRSDWLSEQVRWLRRARAPSRTISDVQGAQAPPGAGRAQVATLLREVYDALVTGRHVIFHVDAGRPFCLSTSPVLADHVFSEHKALVPTIPREELAQILEPEDDVLRRVVDATSPAVSLADLASQLSLPLAHMRTCCETLLRWQVASFLEVIQETTRLRTPPGIQLEDLDWAAALFRRDLPEDVLCSLSFREAMWEFSRFRPWRLVKQRLLRWAPGADVLRILEWLVVKDFVLPMYWGNTMQRFARPPGDCGECGIERAMNRFGPSVQELVRFVDSPVVAVLAERAENAEQLEWLCRFTADVVKPGHPLTGSAFKEWSRRPHIARLIEPTLEPEDFLKRHNDVFQKYYVIAEARNP